jgi:hypothetical protein
MIFRERRDRIAAIVAASLAAVALIIVFVLPPDLLLSAPGTDLISGFVSSRAYLAESLGGGHIPLWNPFTYAGQPFLAGFESAVLYPLNLLFLCLPLARALNFSMLLHLIILGWGMERWAASRNLHPGAAGLAGLVAPFTGVVFPHVFAGHLSALCTMAWIPWTFLGLEAWGRHGGNRWLLLASATICLQVLAGHVQYCFFAAVAAGIQALMRSVSDPAVRRRALPAVAICYLGAAALAAAQLLPGLAASADVIRGQRLDYAFVSMFSFPPENLITALAPWFFGELTTYWGRDFLWEMSLFVGASGLLLIAVALLNGDRKRRGVNRDLAVFGLLFALALGAHIPPLFSLLYEFVPGFGHFRGWSKFTFPAILFLVLVIAAGADVLLRGRQPARQAAWGGLLAGSATMGTGAILIGWPDSITNLLRLVAESHESWVPAEAFRRPEFIQHAGIHAGFSLVLTGLALLAAGAALFLIKRWPFVRFAVPGLLILEMLGFAAGQVTTAHLSDAMPEGLRRFVAEHPGDYRVLNLSSPNNGFLLGAADLWGDNPTVLRRYAEFVTLSQGGDLNHITQNVAFGKIDPVYAILRLRYTFVPYSKAIGVMESRVAPLPRLLLMDDWRLLEGRDAILSAMRDPSFDPRKTLLMESEPDPRPQAGVMGSASLISALPDALEIEVDTDKPALLLITDLYDSNWHAEALPGSVQQSYRLMAADYILRGVPLMAGHHRLRVVYSPTAFPVGVGISAAAWSLWAGLFFRWRRRCQRPGHDPLPT